MLSTCSDSSGADLSAKVLFDISEELNHIDVSESGHGGLFVDVVIVGQSGAESGAEWTVQEMTVAKEDRIFLLTVLFLSMERKDLLIAVFLAPCSTSNSVLAERVVLEIMYKES